MAAERIDGNLLLEESTEYQELVRDAVLRMGIWLHPNTFAWRPHLVPFVVRDASCRSKANPAGEETWGAPDERGFFRDDNSLIKNWVKSLTIQGPSDAYRGKRLGKGFVACHVWRAEAEEAHLHADPLLNSFVPNLVWLPKDLARLSDRAGSYTQRLLQVLARRIYADVETAEPLRGHVEQSWNALPEPTDPPACPKRELNYFADDSDARGRQHDSLTAVVEGIRAIRSGRRHLKVYSKRYGPGLSKLPHETLDELLQFLTPYLAPSQQ